MQLISNGLKYTVLEISTFSYYRVHYIAFDGNDVS